MLQNYKINASIKDLMTMAFDDLTQNYNSDRNQHVSVFVRGCVLDCIVSTGYAWRA